MINHITSLPSQLVPRSVKLNKSPNTVSSTANPNDSENKTWGQNTLDFFIGQSLAQEGTRDELYTLYRLKDGILDKNDYEYITNPLNATNKDYKRFPSKLRCYNIIKPVIEEYIGERLEKPLNPIVVVGNKDADNLFKQNLIQSVNGLLQQQFINKLNEMGVPTGVDSKETPDIAQYVEDYKVKYDEMKAIEGQNIIDFIVYDLELDEKQQQLFEHYLTCGRMFTDKWVVDDNLEYEVIHPLDYFCPINDDNGNVEDKSWGVRRLKYTSKFAILDQLRSKLDKDDLEWLEAQYANSVFAPNKTVFMNSPQMPKLESTLQNNLPNEHSGKDSENITLWKVRWKSFRKVGLLTTIDELGQLQEVDVDETYKINREAGDVSLEWEYITECWEGYRIDGLHNNESRYFGIKPSDIQRSELNSNQKAKLAFGGRIDVDVDGRVISVVKTGYPYQVLYNVFHYQLEKIVNKNKDKLTVIPMGLMPTKAGWNEEKVMYYADALGYIFMDETKPNASIALQGLKSIDMGLSQYINQMWEFLRAIKQEFWDAVGMNRQRFGETNSSDGKAVNEQALFRASLITAELNRKFDKFLERDYQALLDWSKAAWINGKKADFVRNDGNRIGINIDGEEHLGTDYNLFIKNSSIEYNKLKTMMNIALSLNQNGTKGSDIAALLNSNNMTKIEDILRKGEEIQRNYEMQLNEQKNQAIVQASQLKKDAEQLKQETSMYTADKNYSGVIDSQNLITQRELLLANMEVQLKGLEGVDNKDDSYKQTLETIKVNLAQAKQRLDEQKHRDELVENDKDRTNARVIKRMGGSGK